MKGTRKKTRSADPPIPKEDEGYLILDVTKVDVSSLPRIEHLFKGIGGAEKVFEFLEGSDEAEARKILEARRLLTKKQAEHVPFEAYCLAAGVAPKKAFGIISQEVMDQSAKASAMLARARHPEVVEYTIEQALTPAGGSERKMLHQSQGFLPMPKSNVNVFGHVSVDQRNQTQNVMVLPPVEDSVKRMSDRFGEMMAGSIPVIEAPDVIYDEDEG